MNIAIIDACILHRKWERFILIGLGKADYFIPHWSEEIIDETERSLWRIMDKDTSAERIKELTTAFPKALLKNYEKNPTLNFKLKDKDDMHVIAAALHVSPSTIVTENLKHFPVESLKELNIRVMTADEYISEIIESDIFNTMKVVKGIINISKYSLNDLLFEIESKK